MNTDVVTRAHLCRISNGILVFQLARGMSEMRKSKGNAAHDVTHVAYMRSNMRRF